MKKKIKAFKLEAAVTVFAVLFLLIGIVGSGFTNSSDVVRAESAQQTPTPKPKKSPKTDPTVSPTDSPTPMPNPSDPTPTPTPTPSPTM